MKSVRAYVLAKAAASSSSSSAAVDTLGLGSGTWLTHYLRFEEELWAAHATASVAFRVADYEKGGEGGGGGGGASAAAAAGGVGGGKRKGAAAAGGAAAAPAPSDGGGVNTLRAPASRRAILFPATALRVCVEAMQHLLVEAQAREAAEGGGGGGSGSAPVAAAAARGRKRK
jgi:hypothetical protein